MELENAIRSRHMVRAFDDRPIEESHLTQLLDDARQAPSAGNTAATEFVVLTGEARQEYWNVTLPEERRAGFTFPTLPDAGALVLVLTRPEAYPERYSEIDKFRTGLGAATDLWPVPFWWVDAGAVIQNLLLLAHDRGLGALLFGAFSNEPAVKAGLGIPPDRRLVGVVALGHPASDAGRAGRSASRPRPRIETITHYQRWNPIDQARR
ncbi:MAG: nitroreductase family protein [Acidimicrobiales bacterium]